jgi:Zn-dependent peptidase ImmA (M78 family)/DNA-binding XRE family transcriptional regulator
MANFVPVNPDIIAWARDYHDLTQQQLADKAGVHVNQIISWEDDKTKPTFNQAKKLANVLNLPFVYLFLSDPPDLETPLPDLRTRHGRSTKVSPNFRAILYETFDRYEWYREYLEENEALRPLPFVGSFTINDDPLRIAANIRDVLKITSSTREGVDTWSAYLKALSAKVEAARILVMRSSLVGKGTNLKLSADEFQGFVITDKYAPVVFINGRDFIGAQTFTLAHELAHIWIGQSGIVDPDETQVSVPQRDTESFCNLIATEVLVPKAEFVPLWERYSHSTPRLAKEFRVSEIVVLRRAFELNLITSDEFFPRWQKLKDAAHTGATFGRSTHLERIATRHSPLFMDAIIKDTRTGGTLFRDGARLLSMTVPTFSKMIEGREY